MSYFPSWLQGPIDWFQRINPFAPHPQPAPEEPPAAPQPQPHAEAPNAASAESAAHEAPAPVAAPIPLEVARNLEHGISLLKAEQCKRLEEKAHGLNRQVKTIHDKIKNIDTLLSLISQYSQKNPDGSVNANGTVDCTIPEIVAVVASLRRDGVSVPLPDGVLQKAERGHVVNALTNQRTLFSDEQKEHSQEFQQCAVERNSLYQALMSLIAELHRVKSKILGNLHIRSYS